MEGETIKYAPISPEEARTTGLGPLVYPCGSWVGGSRCFRWESRVDRDLDSLPPVPFVQNPNLAISYHQR